MLACVANKLLDWIIGFSFVLPMQAPGKTFDAHSFGTSNVSNKRIHDIAIWLLGRPKCKFNFELNENERKKKTEKAGYWIVPPVIQKNTTRRYR